MRQALMKLNDTGKETELQVTFGKFTYKHCFSVYMLKFLWSLNYVENKSISSHSLD